MALSLQGFAIAKNLSESILDEQVLSVLAGTPIGTDIQLLFNNTKNTSTITVTSTDISGSTILFPDAYAVFTNGTLLTINDSKYYVKNSNGITQFQLSTLADLSTTVAVPPVGVYTRSDEVTQDNLSNYSAVRREAGPTYTSNDNSIGGLADETSYTVSIYSQSPQAVLAAIDTNVDAYNFKVLNSLNKSADFVGSKSLVSTGSVIIRDPDNINNTLGFSNTSPGLFIYDKQSSSIIRAFSSNQNPWEAITSYLQTTSSNITTGKLSLVNTTTGVNIQLKNSTMKSSVTAANVKSTFTHKLPVTVNGETYFLCLKLEP
jgi:hypothetical protein